VIGASNDLLRRDPALLRAGRLNRIVKIGLPFRPYRRSDAQSVSKLIVMRSHRGFPRSKRASA
jgi:ATP-dependent 26S proteasome regulatory subunit